MTVSVLSRQWDACETSRSRGYVVISLKMHKKCRRLEKLRPKYSIASAPQCEEQSITYLPTMSLTNGMLLAIAQIIGSRFLRSKVEKRKHRGKREEHKFRCRREKN